MMSSRRYDHQNDYDNDNDHHTYSTNHNNILACVFPSSHLSRGSDNDDDDMHDALGGRWLSREVFQDPTVRANLAVMNRPWWEQRLRHEEQQPHHHQPNPASDSTTTKTTMMIHRRMVRHVGMVQDTDYCETPRPPTPHAPTLLQPQPHEVQVWAFGLGLERSAMILYGIPDILFAEASHVSMSSE